MFKRLLSRFLEARQRRAEREIAKFYDFHFKTIEDIEKWQKNTYSYRQ